MILKVSGNSRKCVRIIWKECGWSGNFLYDLNSVRMISKMCPDNLKESGWSRNVLGWSGKFLDDPKFPKFWDIYCKHCLWSIFGPCWCTKSCKTTFYAHLLRIWKLAGFTRFIRKVFVTKILLSGKFLFFLTLGKRSMGSPLGDKLFFDLIRYHEFFFLDTIR